MKQTGSMFLELVKFEICQVPVDRDKFAKMKSEDFVCLYQAAMKHDLAHVVAVALRKLDIPMKDDVFQLFKKSIHIILIRHENMCCVQNEICQLFEQEKILFVPLKGAVIREYYKEPWMRNSCDIDILVREDELERAKEALVSKLNYRVLKHKYHDISLQTPLGIRVELHFRIMENEDNIDRVLKKVWNYVKPVGEGRYQCEMTPEFLQFHAMAHMAYHFIHGGCGVRYVVDYWILKQKLHRNQSVLQKMYKKSSLEVFASYIDKLSSVWFEGASHDELSERMEKYIYEGGVFGNSQSIIKARKTKTKGKVSYLIQRVFIPYKEFCSSYPKLQKYPILYPYYTVKRWFKIFQEGMISKAAYEVRLNQEMEENGVEELRELFDALKI